jgi:hypothetical protein
MGAAFWVRRFLIVFAGAFVVIAGVQFLKSHEIAYSATQGLLWAAATATVFTVSRIYQSRRGQHCSICKDTTEMQGGHDNTSA